MQPSENHDDSLFDDLVARGLLYQVTDPALAKQALRRNGNLAVYIGFDPTASSLHVGSLLQITLLRRLQDWGHHPLAVVGGGTGLIGDPSGKSAERKLLDRPTLDGHVAAIRAQLSQFLDFDAGRAELIDNHTWLGEVNLLEFLRDIGKHFSVNAMIARDSVRTRLETRDQGISFTEFSYMLLQAYDFLELYRRHSCRAQFGGSDQWGNIVSGTDLIDRMAAPSDSQRAFGLTVPLITMKSGQKFGKTEEGTVWLDPQLTSPYRFYQFWLGADDEDVLRWLPAFSLRPFAQLQPILEEQRIAPHLRPAQKALAAELTSLVHGAEACQQVQAATAVLFGGDPKDLSLEALSMLEAELPTFHGQEREITLQSLLVGSEPGRAFASNGEARRAMQANSVSINGHKIAGELASLLPPATLLHDRYALIRVGKKQFFLAILPQA